MTSARRQQQIDDIRTALTTIAEPGAVYELRVPKFKRWPKSVAVGYFDNLDLLAAECARLDNTNPTSPAVYVMLNPVNPSFLALASNRIEEKPGIKSAEDKDIARRIWLPIDTDPDRNPKDISATDTEHAAALARAAQITDYLTGCGWPAPVVADSGNGGHLLYRIDLPNTPDAADLVQRCLQALHSTFSDDTVKVDTTVYNAARIWKVYGTTARKGDDVPERPHRRAQLLHVPEALTVVPLAQLQALADLAPTTPVKSKTTERASQVRPGRAWHAGTPEAVEDWAAGHGLQIGERKFKDGSFVWSVDCVTGDHTDGAAFFLNDDGFLNYKCHHASCARRHIPDVLARYPPPNAADDTTEPKWTVSKKIADNIASWGYDLWLNDMDDSVWNGNRQMDDAQRCQLRMRARDEGYAKHKLMGALDDAILAIAADRRKHPIREYLATLQWDGQDHIATLASYITDRHDVIVYPDGTVRTVVHAFLYRWLISAVAKIHGDANAARDNKILVFAAEQGKGKSHLAGWLCPLLEFFVERHINPDDKDASLLRARAWVWEIGELGATTRRADVEALKAHVTASSITERKAYGHFDTKKPTIASYVGTVNPDGVGFLTDPTGSRRFSVVEISDIDWEYATAVDVNQLWGQAMHLWRMDPRSYRYTPEEVATQTVNANEHTETDPYGDMIASTFEIDANDASTSLSSTEALHYLRTYAGLSHGNDRQAGRELARALRRYWNITGRRSNGRTVYQGLRLAGKWSAKVNFAEDAITAAGI